MLLDRAESLAETTLDEYPTGFPALTTLGSQLEHQGADSLTALAKLHR
jgi:hypothetical protein